MPTAQRLAKLKRVASQRQAGLTIVLEDVFDPHNVGAIARSCDAFGIQDLHVIFEAQPAFDPKAAGKNSATATNKWLRYHIHRSSEAALQALRAEGWQLVASALDAAATPLPQADFCAPKIALLVGNEKTGLSARALALADSRVTIPMRGIAQSLNVSVAAALMLYEASRQRQARCPQLSSPDAAQVTQTLDYLLAMHQQHSRRNKRLRVQRARQRGKTRAP